MFIYRHRLVFFSEKLGDFHESAEKMHGWVEKISDKMAGDALDKYLSDKPDMSEELFAEDEERMRENMSTNRERIIEKIRERLAKYIRENESAFTTPVNIIINHNIDPATGQPVDNDEISTAKKMIRQLWMSASDIIAEKVCEVEHAEIQRNQDTLMKIPNRRAFIEKLSVAIEQNIRRGETFSVAIFDLDHFKAVNDTHGHGAGDQVLCETSRRIKESLDRKLDFVARYGGEEFVFIFPGTPEKGACIAIHKISEAIKSTPYNILNKRGEKIEISISGSTGVAEYTGIADDIDGGKVINSADSCLYVLKGEEPDADGYTADRRGEIVCERRVITKKDIWIYKKEFKDPEKRSSLPPPVSEKSIPPKSEW